MNLNEWIRLIYGLTLGTSTPLIDPGKRYLFPLVKKSLNKNVDLIMGGAGNGFAIKAGENILLVNTNMGTAAEKLYEWYGDRVKTIINQKAHPYFVGGNYLYPECENTYVGAYPRGKLVGEFGDRKLPNKIVSEPVNITFGEEELEIFPIREGMFANNLVVYLKNSQMLMLGDLYFNKVHPVLSGGADVGEWLGLLDQVISKFRPESVLPAEGEMSSPAYVSAFVEYLKDFSNLKMSVGTLKEKYASWSEIPGIASSEINFKVFRQEVHG